MASATLALSPIEMRFAGRITGLHKGESDWPRFLRDHGCVESGKGNWQWDGKLHNLHRIHQKLFPYRGCRVRKEDLGEECPETIIKVLAFKVPEAEQIEREWRDIQEMIDRLTVQEGAERAKLAETKAHMRMWKRCEDVLVPYVAQRVKKDLAAGHSVALFMNFDDTRIRMGKFLGTKSGFYGGQNLKQRKHYEEQFQSDRERVLISNIKAGGASVSLHDVRGEFPRIAYIFPTDHVVAMEQATGRVDRVGGKSTSQQFIPCLAGGMTERMVQRTRAKMKRIATLNNGLGGSIAKF